MARKDNIKAAQNYEDSLIYASVSEQCDVQKAFITGANWRINSVWHDITETPENNRVLLCITDHGYNIFGPNNSEFKEIVEYFHIKKWAYIDDLIPNTEE